MKQTVRVTAVTLATLAVVAILWQVRNVVILFILALTVASTARPIVDRLSALGLSAGLALLITYLLAAVIGGSLFYLVGNALFGELERLMRDVVIAYQQVQAQWPTGNPWQQLVVARLPTSRQLFEVLTGPAGLALLQRILGFTINLGNQLAQFLIILVLSIYWNATRGSFERLWLSLLSGERRTQVRRAWRKIRHGTGAHVRSEIIQSVLAGAAGGLGYWAMGIRYPTLLAIVVALAHLIPLLGPILAILGALGAGLLISPTLGGLAGLYTLLVLTILRVWIEPRLANRQRINPLVVMLVILAMAQALGVLGLLIAPPLAAAIMILIEQLLPRPGEKPSQAPSPQTQLARLRERLEAIRSQLDQAPARPPELANLADRLDKLLQKAEQTL